MSTRHRILFFVTAWFIAFMPVMFWWNTWFGRTLSDKQLAEYLRDDKHPAAYPARAGADWASACRGTTRR